MWILALDPGITTGYALGVLDEKLFIAVGESKMDHREFYDFLQRTYPHHMVCESFEFRQNRDKDKLVLYPVELIGLVKFFCSSPMVGPHLSMQTAAQGKSYHSDAVLKKLGVYQAGMPHGMDAVRHLLRWLVFGGGFRLIEGNEPTMELVEEEWLRNAYIR